MPRELYRQRWLMAQEMGTHGAERAAFGRYVARIGGYISARSEQAVMTAYHRFNFPGHLNRRMRRYLSR